VGPASEAAASWRIRPAEGRAAYSRATVSPLAASVTMREAAASEPERDEVDELFTTGHGEIRH
jgi:hypothetical protein